MTINSYVFSQLMIELGCARQIDMQNDNTLEFKRVEEIWLCLLESARSLSMEMVAPQMVQLGDVKLFLMAILGVTGNKRLGLSRPTNSARFELPYGWLDENNQLCLSDKCVE